MALMYLSLAGLYKWHLFQLYIFVLQLFHKTYPSNICSFQFHMEQDIYDKGIIICIPFGKLKVKGISQTIYYCMDFCGVPSMDFYVCCMDLLFKSPFAPVPC